MKDTPVIQFEIGSAKNFVYLLLDWTKKKAAIVDPQKDLKEPLAVIQKNGFDLEQIFLTHSHHDHIAGVPELVSIFPNIKIRIHSKDSHRLPRPALDRIELIQDGDILEVGSLEVKVLHTPGHSAGESCFFLQTTPPQLFTGDTVFIRDCGRTDLESGSNDEMFASLQRIKLLPKETVILPGHHYKPETSSTLEKELRESPPFQCRSVQELSSLP